MHASEAPPTVAARRESLRDRFADAPGVLCCLDFDGTLAPIVPDADAARMAPACRRGVTDLVSESSVEVAMISGRAVEDLRERVDLDGVAYAGNHGLELAREERVEVHPAAAEARDAIDDLCAEIEARTDSIPGCTVEHKGVTATVHYRQVADDVDVSTVVEVLEAVVAAVESENATEFEVLDGKQIHEVRPDVDCDKGHAVESLDQDVPDAWETMYVGDDATDEDAFDAVEPEGVGVLVGEKTKTAASVRVPNQSDVADVLDLLATCQDGTEASGSP